MMDKRLSVIMTVSCCHNGWWLICLWLFYSYYIVRTCCKSLLQSVCKNNKNFYLFVADMYYCTCVCFYLLGLFFPSLLHLLCRLGHGSVFVLKLLGEGWVQMVAPFFVFVPSSVSCLWRWGHNQQNHFSCASAYCPEDIFLNHWRFCYQTLCNGASPWTMLSYEIECLGQLSSKPRWWSGVRLLKYGCLSHVLWDMLFRKNEKKNCLRWHSIVSQSVGWLFCNATVNLTVPPNCNLRPQQEFVHPSLS